LDSAISPYTIIRSSTLRSSTRFWKEILATSVGPSRVAHVAATSNPGRSEPQPELRTLNLDHFHAPSHESKSILMLDPIVCADGELVLSVKDQQGKSLAEAEPFA